MAGCCPPPGYETVFGERQARKDARRYRRRGLSKAARRLVELARPSGTVLEVGGGVGAIQIELLEAGATHATNVELSSGYEEEARQLLRERRLEDRAERRIADFVGAGETVEAADVVVMHRVVCCYPEPDKLVGAAAEHARRRVVLSFPPRNAATRLLVYVLERRGCEMLIGARLEPEIVGLEAGAYGRERRVTAPVLSRLTLEQQSARVARERGGGGIQRQVRRVRPLIVARG